MNFVEQFPISVGILPERLLRLLLQVDQSINFFSLLTAGDEACHEGPFNISEAPDTARPELIEPNGAKGAKAGGKSLAQDGIFGSVERDELPEMDEVIVSICRRVILGETGQAEVWRQDGSFNLRNERREAELPEPSIIRLALSLPRPD